MMSNETNELVLRQLIRETLMQEYMYKWTSGAIEKGTPTAGTRSRPSSGKPGPLDSVSGKIANTDLGRKIKSTTKFLTTRLIKQPMDWLTKTLRRAPTTKLAKLGFSGGVAGLTISGILDYFKSGNGDEAEAFSAQTECMEKIETNSGIIAGTKFIKDLSEFARGLASQDMNSIDPARLGSDLLTLRNAMDIPAKIRKLNDVLTREDLSSLSGISAFQTLSLEEPRGISSDVMRERAQKLVVDSAVSDMYVAITNELVELADVIEEKIKSVEDPTKKSDLSDVFRTFDRNITDDLNLAQYPELSDLLSDF